MAAVSQPGSAPHHVEPPLAEAALRSASPTATRGCGTLTSTGTRHVVRPAQPRSSADRWPTSRWSSGSRSLGIYSGPGSGWRATTAEGSSIWGSAHRVGLLYQQANFRQTVDADGTSKHSYPHDASPVCPCAGGRRRPEATDDPRGPAGPCRPGRVWKTQVGGSRLSSTHSP